MIEGTGIRNYKIIKAFQLADDFVVEIYKVTQQFPKEELYGLTSQLRRAVVSVPTNIAEGASRIVSELDYKIWAMPFIIYGYTLDSPFSS